MDKTCKYYQYQRYVSYDNGQTWQPMNQFQRGELMEFNSPDCGAGIDVIYKWVLLDVNTDYYCDECPEGTCIEPTDEYIESWGLMNPYEDYWCSGTTKMYKQIKQISYDGGLTWTTPTPIEVRPSNIVCENFSTECGFEPSYRWHEVPITEEYICSGGSMYYKEYYQISNDGQKTWHNVIPTSSRTGNMYSECARQCGCGVPMFEANYSDSSSYKVVCGVSGDVVTTAITKSYKPISAMTDALIGDCATAIDNYALSSSYNLSACTIGSGVTSIGEYAFYDSGIKNITIPNRVESIGKDAFKYCRSLESIDIPNSVTSIGEDAFRECIGITSVTIGSGLTNIYEGTFYYCTSLSSVTIGNNVTSIGNSAFNSCSGLTSITIPDSVTSIGNSAFNSCSGLTSITIPDSVTSIGNDAFYYCTSIENVTIGSGVTSFGNDIFRNCTNLNTAIIYSNIGDKLFSGCTSLSSVTIGNSVTSIGQNSFNKCTSLSSITIPNSVTSIGDGAFENCTSLPIENSIRYADTYAIRITDDLTTYTLKNNTRFIGDEAFYYCTSLTSINIPESVIDIGNEAFYYCTNLTSITIPSGVIRIGAYAFNNCTSLSSITVNAVTPPELGSDAFYGSTCPIYVPASSINAYKTDTGWSNYANRITSL